VFRSTRPRSRLPGEKYAAVILNHFWIDVARQFCL
jgi:hypothetical protein